ncbi:hypothetical protein PIB30_077488 [Stylosanthes scabra]|uniref:CST complex subunit CTC1 n=1 Tax=Stylosanthes scabra TaxID=79078 RepID=A0ABU6VPQ7_9FABA|nr:hypothetical protein [Stylosanthes scabra]
MGNGIENRGESPKLVLEEVLREENRFSGKLRIDSLVPEFGFNTQNCLRIDSSSLESILKEEECHRVDITANIPVLGVIYAIKKETPLYIYMRKNVNVRGNERVVLGEVRMVVVRDMYWTSRVAKITDRALYPYWESMVGDSHSVFVEAFQVQVQAWKVAKHVYVLWSSLSDWLSSFRCELSVCNVTISAERIRCAVSHVGVLYLVSEQFFPCEPEEWNCYASEHNLNQGIMREMLPKAMF